MNRAARRLGASQGMTRLEAEALAVKHGGLDQGLHLLSRSLKARLAHAVMLECAAIFSPRIEQASQGIACAFVWTSQEPSDCSATRALAERLRTALLAQAFVPLSQSAPTFIWRAFLPPHRAGSQSFPGRRGQVPLPFAARTAGNAARSR